MDIDKYFDIIASYPAVTFVAGMLLGYFLHGLVSVMLSSGNGGKKPGRYQRTKADTGFKRAAVLSDIQEPSFDLPEAVIMSLKPQRVGGIGFDQHGNKI